MTETKKTWITSIIIMFFLFWGSGLSAKTLTADVIIIGAGTAGLPAAVEAAEKGAAVIILKKPTRQAVPQIWEWGPLL